MVSRHSIETWIDPNWDHTAIVRFENMFEELRAKHPAARLHLLIETGDRYAELRSRLAKRAAKKRRDA
jgi:hypothetical protein